MGWVNVAVAAASAYSAYNGKKAAKKAADAQVEAAEKASNTEMEMFEQNREDMKPWRDAGTVALSQMLAGTKDGGEFNRNFTMADFVKDPGYQFRMDQGQQALERGAAARGGVLNGGALREATRYGQDYASNEFNNSYNRFNNDLTTRFGRLSSIAGTGQTSTAQIGQLGTQVAGQIGENTLQAGNARASGYVGSANAINNGVQSLGNYFTTQQMLSRMPASQPTNNTGVSPKTYS